MKKGVNETGKIIFYIVLSIIATIILGPLLFVGSCIVLLTGASFKSSNKLDLSFIFYFLKMISPIIITLIIVIGVFIFYKKLIRSKNKKKIKNKNMFIFFK